MNRSWIVFVLGISLASSAWAVLDWEPCRKDLQRFCPKAKLGSPEAETCLSANATSHGMTPGGWNGELSQSCNEAVRHAKFHQLCKRDIQNFCKDLPPGAHRIHDCMRKHAQKAEKACGEYLRDYLGVEFGGNGLTAC